MSIDNGENNCAIVTFKKSLLLWGYNKLLWLIVGLGNPGKKYELTRHNMGFLVLDRFAQKEGIVFQEKIAGARTGTGLVGEQRVVLAKPLTYMNRSGTAVRHLIEALNVSLEYLLVVHDDLDLAFGRIKMKQKGGHGGHKGVESVMEHLGRDDFLRLKVGIGKPDSPEDGVDYVLAPFPDHQVLLLTQSVQRASEAIEALLLYGAEKAMNMYN